MSAASTTQRCKVNLERLLRCCERLADEMRTESDRRRLLTYLSVLERYWHELDAARCNAAVLAEYRRKIEHIGDLLDDEKMLAGSGGALARSRLRNHTTLSCEQANSELASRLNAASRVQQELRSQLMHHVEGAPSTADEAASLSTGHAGVEARGAGALRLAASVAAGPNTVATSTAAAAVAAAASLGGASIGGRAAARVADAREALLPGSGVEAESVGQTLETQRQLQEELLEDLGQLVSELKDKSMQARDAVRDDTATLDETGSVVDLNQAKVDENNERLKAQVKSMRGSKCWTWLMLLVVCVLFVATFFFMKVFAKKKKHL